MVDNSNSTKRYYLKGKYFSCRLPTPNISRDNHYEVFLYPLEDFRQGGYTAKSGNHVVGRLKRTRLEAEKAVRKLLNHLSKRYSGPEVSSGPEYGDGQRSDRRI